MRPKKLSYLPGFEKGVAISHGGDLGAGKRKTFRPIDPKQSLHVVLRSSKAKGELSMLHPKHCNHIENFVRKIARKWGVRVYRFANVGNHLHLLIQVPTRAAWQRFSKEISGGIAQIVTGARKGVALTRKSNDSLPKSAQRGFWDHLMFTRIVNYGRDFNGVSKYLIKNLFDAAGVPMTKLFEQGYRLLLVSSDGAVSGIP